jgi:predicted phosphodiesterase
MRRLKTLIVPLTRRMELDFASDLHAEMGTSHWAWPPRAARAPVLVLAGDVGKVRGGSWEAAVRSAAAAYAHGAVYVVTGNHELYSDRVDDTEDALLAEARVIAGSLANVTLLDRAAGAIDTGRGWRIAGCPLWTHLLDATPQERADVVAGMRDFSAIRVRRADGSASRLTALDVSTWHLEDAAELARVATKQLEDGAAAPPLVFVTHHGSCAAMNPPEYAASRLTAGFVARDVDYLVNSHAVTAWISGHTHGSPVEWRGAHGCLCVSRCCGYPHEPRRSGAPYLPAHMVLERQPSGVTVARVVDAPRATP